MEGRRAARPPWVRAAFASLTIGLLTASALAAYAWHQRNEAVAARELAETSYAFIAVDVLGSPSPAKSSADATGIDPITRATHQIDQRFPRAPRVAARHNPSLAPAVHHLPTFGQPRQARVTAKHGTVP